ncbi:hypothetical protein CLF_110876 [Clonorchis sinensis]|uniref:C2H2-type domain-containing protein n=1 Tax=Clonorchis sinensis TaxID=79923 RepID=G7YL85_CLOSI|nr:hypothetical protein CLF_110876 [Clonorchis sinensis]
MKRYCREYGANTKLMHYTVSDRPCEELRWLGLPLHVSGCRPSLPAYRTLSESRSCVNSTVSLASLHQFQYIQARLLKLMCEECDSCCKRKASLIDHGPPQVHGSVGTTVFSQSACADCSRLFPMNTELSHLHLHAHPVQHNANELSRVKNSECQ